MNKYTRARLQRNEESKANAEHDGEPWSADEMEELVGYWDGSEGMLAEIAELLGRTIEACRQRYYIAVKDEGQGTRAKVQAQVRGWLVGFCFTCGTFGDVFSDGSKAECEDCRG